MASLFSGRNRTIALTIAALSTLIIVGLVVLLVFGGADTPAEPSSRTPSTPMRDGQPGQSPVTSALPTPAGRPLTITPSNGEDSAGENSVTPSGVTQPGRATEVPTPPPTVTSGAVEPTRAEDLPWFEDGVNDL